MLVHKRSLGVLDRMWDGESYQTWHGVKVPLLRPVILAGLGLDPDEWWEVTGSLAAQVKRCYPWFVPVVENGELAGIEPYPKWKIYGEAPPEPAAPQRTGRRRRRRKYVEKELENVKIQKIPTGGGALVSKDWQTGATC